MSVEKMPVITDACALVEWLADRSDELTTEQLSTALARVGRNAGPSLLTDLVAEELVTAAELAMVIGDVSSSAEYPDAYLEHETWCGLFTIAGYTVDGVPTERAATSVTLYRGSVSEQRADWSWTDSLEVASRYASGEHYHRPHGTV